MRTICNKPFGKDLAEKVADHLFKGKEIAYRHRDYCGMGLIFAQNKYQYGLVGDDGIGFHPYQTFEQKSQFVEWLSNQSDKSLQRKQEGYPEYSPGNRITRARLLQNLS